MPRTATSPPAAVEYPYSDGKMMAEAPRHGDAIVYALQSLRAWFGGHRRVQVGANMFLYYQQGDPGKRVTPDLFVVRGLEALPEPSYKLWEAGRPPTFVLEVASPSTEDRGEKQALYASLGVREYWRFNPIGVLVGASREGRRLEGGTLRGLGYEPLAQREDGAVYSAVLELDVRVDEREGKGHLLRFRDPKTGSDLLTFGESERQRLEEKRRRLAAEEGLRVESAARRRAEAARRQLETAGKKAEAARSEAEAARKEAEAAYVESEAARSKEAAARLAAENELALLKARIEKAEPRGTTDRQAGDA